MSIGRIARYRDLDHDTRFRFNLHDSAAAAQGFLCKPIKGAQYVIETVVVTLQHGAAAGQLANVTLVTVNAAGVVTPAAPGFRPLSKLFCIGNKGSGQTSGVFTVNGIERVVPEGFGIGWHCITGAVGIYTYSIPTFMSILVAGRIEGVRSGEATDTFAGTLQPFGGGT